MLQELLGSRLIVLASEIVWLLLCVYGVGCGVCYVIVVGLVVVGVVGASWSRW